MGYESPINIIYGPGENKLENEVLTAIHNLGIDVNKEELVRALRYDREQYQKGYEDRDKEIVRCKDCIHRGNAEKCVVAAISKENDCPLFMLDNHGEWYCADGKKRNDDDD